MPPADPGSLRRLRQTAKALRIGWPKEMAYPDFVRALDPAQPAEAAMLMACTSLFRGAGYQAFSGGVPDDAEHAALAIDYAHVTAPLRRLVDRFGTEVCLALAAGRELPEPLRTALPTLPEVMAASDTVAGKVSRACVDRTEAFLLADRVGDELAVVVLRPSGPGGEPGEVYLPEPPVLARSTGSLPAGETVRVRLTEADPATGRIEFAAPQ
jgi:exoribonuclease R